MISNVDKHSPAKGLTNDPRFLSSVERGFQVLDALAAASGPMSLTEISRQTGLAIPTLQRLTSTLVNSGYVLKEKTSKRFKPSVKTVDLLHGYLSRNQFASRAWPHLVGLREQIGLDVSLSVPHGNSMIYVHRLPGYPGNFENTLPGRKVPMHLSASGRCILSFNSQEQIEQYLELAEMPLLTPWSSTDKPEIMRQVSLCREQGYAVVKQEASPGIMTLGCPVMQKNEAIAGVSVHIPAAGTDKNNFLSQVLSPALSVAHTLSIN